MPMTVQDQQFSRAVLGSLPAQIAVTDSEGVIVAVNEAWEKFARENGARRIEDVGVGAHYLETCRGAAGTSDHAARAYDGIRRVLSGDIDEWTMEYPCHAPTCQRWFLMTVTPLHAGRYTEAARDGDLNDPIDPASGRHTRRPETSDGTHAPRLRHDVPDAEAVAEADVCPMGAVISHLNITDRVLSEHRTKDLLEEVECGRRRREELLADVPGVVWETYGRPDDAGQRIDFVSRHVEKMLGYSVKEWLDKPNFWLTVVHPDDRVRVARETAAAYNAGRTVTSEFRWMAKDARAIWVEANASCIRDESGQVVGMRGVTMDISRRKFTQSALRRRAQQVLRIARQLKRRNAELDQFAYVASHDLRAPLRGIDSLSRWLEEDLARAFNPSTRQQMTLLRSRVRRMQDLIAGLLEFSRVGRDTTRLEAVNVDEVVRATIDLLSPSAGFEVQTLTPLPTLMAPRIRVEQVFLNLIGNAIKHTAAERPDGPGHVTVSAEDRGGFWHFRVADDGPGIEPQYHDKIFLIFQTLRSRDEVEGTGLGLALVRKIVEEAGGTIGVKSRPGDGATFHFTWPKHTDPRGRDASPKFDKMTYSPS